MSVFTAYCENHGGPVLLFTHNITAMFNESDGIDVHFQCPCGYQGVWHVGGEREQRLA